MEQRRGQEVILQALCEYYQRKAADPESGIAPEGSEWKALPFIIVIDADGGFVTIEDTREGEGKSRRARLFLVPCAEKRTVGVKANLLWDNVEYALGANPRGRSDVAMRHQSFLQRLQAQLPERSADHVVHALLTFLEGKPLDRIEESPSVTSTWNEALETNANVTFRIDGSVDSTLCETFRRRILPRAGGTTSGELCLASGAAGPIARIHPAIKGVRDAQPSGASLVSFNLAAFESFGRTQNFNAPISELATFAYTTALNCLLSKDSKNRVQVGDATTVFWSDRVSTLENQFAALFTMAPKDDPDRDILAVQSLYKSLDTGASIAESQTRFYVLGLAPNAARIAVRFWHHGTIAEFSQRIRQHFDDLDIARDPKDTGRLALFWLLVEIAPQGKVENVPPNLAGDLVRSVLTGTPYPVTLLQQTIRRIRAEREVTRTKAAILKAMLNRDSRIHSRQQMEITVALDPTNVNPGYRLGRLFAVLEKIQEDAQPGINATIRDRFYGAASSSPVTVFPQLLKLKNHHLAKLEHPAFRAAHEKRLTEIIGGLSADMPAHLAMEDQARFAIGYYHQRQALFTKSTSAEPSPIQGITP